MLVCVGCAWLLAFMLKELCVLQFVVLLCWCCCVELLFLCLDMLLCCCVRCCVVFAVLIRCFVDLLFNYLCVCVYVLLCVVML